MKISTKKPWIPDGFSLEYHNDNGKIDPSKLSLHLEPEQERGVIKGELLAERMKEKGLNSAVLKYLLDNPKLIPDEWKGKKGVYFFGTILRHPHGRRYVLSLYWSDGEWHWYYYWLDHDWNANNPSAVLASPRPLDPKSSFDTLNFEKRLRAVEDIIKHHNL